MKIDGNSILSNAQGRADSKRSDGDFKAALSRAKGDRSSAAIPEPIIRQNSALRLPDDASQVPDRHASRLRLENFAAINADATGGGSKTNFWYQVRKGDTLSGIVKSRLKTLDQTVTTHAIAQLTRKIAQLNNISNQDRIFPDQKLSLAILEKPRTSSTEVASTHSPRSATAPLGVATTQQALDFRNAAQLEAARASSYHADAEPVYQGNYTERSAASQHVDNAYLPDRLRDHSNASPAIDHRVDNVTVQPRSPPSADLAGEKEKTSALPDIFYKGLVGKALDALPINPEAKTALQQTNAIVSGPMAGRSLAAITGLASPVLAVAGLIWGLFAAKNIGTAATDRQSTSADTPPAGNSVSYGKSNIPETSPEPVNYPATKPVTQEQLSFSALTQSAD